MLKRVLIGLGAIFMVVVLIAGIILFRTFTFGGNVEVQTVELADVPDFNGEEIAKRLSTAIDQLWRASVGWQSIHAVEHAAGDDHGLHLASALENIEDTGILQNAANRIFQREAIAAMDLNGVIGGCPCDARAEELCHAGFEVTALARVFLTSREIGELAHRHELSGHHNELIGHAREFENRTAKLNPVERIAQTKLISILADANGAGGRLYAGAFKGRHEMFESHAFDFTKKV